MSEHGKYIVIEGNDGTGKSTQVDLLAEWLRGDGRSVQVVEEPGSDEPDKSTPVANELRAVIKNGSLQRSGEINLALFSAARRELWREKIEPALARGAIVLSARNYLSTLAYQGKGEGLGKQEILRVTRVFTGERYMSPDLTLVLTLGHEGRMRRIAERGELDNPDTFESRGGDFQDRVNDAYVEIAGEMDLPTIDASSPKEDVQQEVRKYIQSARIL